MRVWRRKNKGKTCLVGGEKLMAGFLVLQGRPMSGWWPQRRLRRDGGSGREGGKKKLGRKMVFSQLWLLISPSDFNQLSLHSLLSFAK
jgi:hypothetical protein